jgi:D-sedoheptulose 7-phosphate isomerase
MLENEKTEQQLLSDLIGRYPDLSGLKEEISQAFVVVKDCYAAGGKILLAGNGGSAADAEHIVGELMKGFRNARPLQAEEKARLVAAEPELGAQLAGHLQGAMMAIALSGHPALSTAFLNDVSGEMVYAQQVHGYGKEGDVFLGISTSGNSANICYAAVAAKARGMNVIAMTGMGGGKLAALADVTIAVPERETFLVQERHLPIYHCLCLMLEAYFFQNGSVVL